MDIIYRNKFLQEVRFCHFISYIYSTGNLIVLFITIVSLRD